MIFKSVYGRKTILESKTVSMVISIGLAAIDLYV